MKNRIPLFLALLGGAAGFCLRKWQLSAGFEPDTGLAIAGAPSALALMACSALVAAGCILLCLGRKEPVLLENAFPAGKDIPFLTIVVLAGFLLLGSAVLEGMSLTPRAAVAGESKAIQFVMRMLPPMRVMLCGLAGPCTIVWAMSLSRGTARQSLSLLVICLLFCVWLISDYQARAADPVTMDYLYEILAIVCTLMGLYYIAGYAFQEGKPRRTMVLCLMGIYFSLVTLADSHTPSELVRYGFAVLFLTAHTDMLLAPSHTGGPTAKEKPETEETTHE